jgi:hypothetical protein
MVRFIEMPSQVIDILQNYGAIMPPAACFRAAIRASFVAPSIMDCKRP